MSREKKKSPAWIVYKLVNRTQKEIYFGISNRPMHSLQDHQKAEIPCTSHWDFMRNDIEHHVVGSGLGQHAAVDRAKELAKMPHLKGFKVINTFSAHAD